MLLERFLCDRCLADLPLTRNACRSRNPMADRYNARIQEHLVRFEPYAYAAALFYYRYDSGYRNITQVLKYRRDFHAGKHFARMLGRELAASPLFRDADLVIPVPLHWTRKWKRGYNQAEVIARELAKALPSARMRTDILKRGRRTRSQAHLGVGQKQDNVSGAFRLTAAGRKRLSEGLPHHVLLVDDVFTTGATAGDCHRALREMLPPEVRISAAMLAVVEDV